ncbi:MAG: leucine-rich repeat domain-containing protein [Clostridia bacterium]|nr:leucine-rich repeat domain-containing protein [Clostridia bacterium]
MNFTKIFGKDEYKVEVKEEYSSIESLNIPSKYKGLPVTEIDDNAFYKCTKLKNIILPGTLKSIGNNAFAYCSSLKTVVLPENLEKLGETAFAYCTELENIVLPDSLSIISGGCFLNCESIKSVSLPSNLIKIEEGGFDSCTSLESIVLPDGLQEIGTGAFWNCGALDNIKIPKSVVKLGRTIISRETKIYFEDVTGWQYRYALAEEGEGDEYYGDWIDIDSDVMANYDLFKQIMFDIKTNKDLKIYEPIFQKV